ncbi:MAG: thiamine-phosphate kinase [Nitrospinaceae bacterium]|nr:MAG: thiamine-phosphate kinase [Nitrospinaceae bacterium]
MSDFEKLGEFGLIARFQSRLKHRSRRVRLGIGDDAAVYSPRLGWHQVASTDALVETVHFRTDTTPPERLGEKAIAVNVSDIAAMGGVPLVALVSLGLPASTPLKFIDGMMKGFEKASADYGIELAGGDTVASPRHLFINVTLVGEVRKSRYFTRAGARPGDTLMVTGSLGDAALGLALLGKRRQPLQGGTKHKNFLCRRHQAPTARVREAALLARSRARVGAMIDISDGLVQDLSHLLESGGLGARLWEDALPHSTALRRICAANRLNPLSFSLSGGEDYELLFTLAPVDVKKITRQFQKANALATPIGEVTANGGQVSLLRSSGRLEPLPRALGYDHFKPASPKHSGGSKI